MHSLLGWHMCTFHLVEHGTFSIQNHPWVKIQLSAPSSPGDLKSHFPRQKSFILEEEPDDLSPSNMVPKVKLSMFFLS